MVDYPLGRALILPLLAGPAQEETNNLVTLQIRNDKNREEWMAISNVQQNDGFTIYSLYKLQQERIKLVS